MCLPSTAHHWLPTRVPTEYCTSLPTNTCAYRVPHISEYQHVCLTSTAYHWLLIRVPNEYRTSLTTNTCAYRVSHITDYQHVCLTSTAHHWLPNTCAYRVPHITDYQHVCLPIIAPHHWQPTRVPTEYRTLLGYYVTSIGNSLPTFRDNLSVQFNKLEDGTDKLYRNTGKELPLLLRNSSKERSSHLLRSWSLASHMPIHNS